MPERNDNAGQIPPARDKASSGLTRGRVQPTAGGALDQIVQAALDQIDDATRKGEQELSWFSINEWKKYLAGIDVAADQCVNTLLVTTLEGADAARKKKILEVVKDRRSKIPLSTGITNQIIGICQSVLAFGAGGLALTLAFVDKASKFSIPVQKFLAIAGIFYLELVVVSILVLILYMFQARFRFPFLYFEKIGNAWPWFYYASISSDVPRGAIELSRKRLKASKLYAQDLVKFTEKVLEEDYVEQLRNEIQQYFLLMAYQGYVHQFSLRLVNTFTYGFVGAFLAALILLALVSLFEFRLDNAQSRRSNERHNRHRSLGGVAVRRTQTGW